MAGLTHPIIAREGWPFILAVLIALIAAFRIGDLLLLAGVIGLLALLIALFRDPPRDVPAKPLAVIAPVDGRVISVMPTDRGMLQREALRVSIRVNNFGAYTARSPVEGKVLNLQDNLAEGSRLLGIGGLWMRTDERDDIVLVMRGPRFLGRPSAFIRYGERLGQGQRCAFLRLARRADVYLPLTARVEVKPGDVVRAGEDLLATLIHK